VLDHVYIVASDMAAAERFYDAVMGALGVVKVAYAGHPDRIYIAIRQGTVPEAPYPLHWCFKARSRAEVDAFWDAGRAAGGSDDGAPGLRAYHASYYAAFLRDPDGNRIEAVCHRVADQ
jgi:catechol 2,3-dioxygenase-like lactoylglutathione lyase family enzyme